MQLTKRTKYWLIGGTAAAVTMITIPLLTTSCGMTQDLPPWRLGPWKNVPSNITADKIVQQFSNKNIKIQAVDTVSNWSFAYSLNNQKTLADCLQEYINFQLYTFNEHNKTFQWTMSWQKNLEIKLTPIKEKQEYKLTLSLMSGPHLKVTTAKDYLYITGFQNNKVSNQNNLEKVKYFSLYVQSSLTKNILH
ncbi:hypothetical protein [Ureaplasma ceti]|uniref:Lipoprotein n=1 Tax=Ureaplasma ceti TaxID=3119530 RepID=A0ABP9U7H9_9BACT